MSLLAKIQAREARRRAELLTSRRAEIASKQRMCTSFGCWASCSRPSCRRDKICRGDTITCFARYWKRYPAAYHAWIVAAGDAREAGFSMEDAMRMADSQAPGGSGCAEFPWVRPYLKSFDKLHKPAGAAATTATRARRWKSG